MIKASPKDNYTLLYKLDRIKKVYTGCDIYKLYNTHRLSLGQYMINFSAILPRISVLINLRELYLTGNELGKFPKEITRLSNLEIVDLSFNRITKLPRMIRNLVNLEYLFLQGNCLRELPSEISKLEKLQELDLRGNWVRKLPKGFNQNLYSVIYTRTRLLDVFI